MGTSETPAVSAENLVIHRGDVHAVDGISFSAKVGEVTVVLGPNGAGKTTTIEHFEGYVARDSGTSTVLGLDPQKDRATLATRVGIMLQSGGIQPAIKPIELLEQYASFYADAKPPQRLLAEVGLADRARTPFRRLSGGEQQRLSLALALVGKPELLFLDEPTAGVDLEGRDLIRSLARELVNLGATVVLTTHDLEEAQQLADYVVILNHGKVVGAGTPHELTSGQSRDLRFTADAGLSIVALSERVGHEVKEVSPGDYVVEGDPTPALVAATTAWLAEHNQAIGDLRAGTQDLEDVFRALTSQDLASGEELS